MKKTLISHFYNEEYLLPFWLNHHKKIFQEGILVDYGSTDNSRNIIKEICPHWHIVDSNQQYFDALLNDYLISIVEKSVSGWRIVLNTTEFLVGKFDLLNDIHTPHELFIPSLVMVDSLDNEYKNVEKDLIKERTFGISPFDSLENFKIRRARRFSNFFSYPPTGRHYENYDTKDFLILWYGFSPFNEDVIKRKLQIQNKMPESDKKLGRGAQHLTDREGLIKAFKNYQSNSRCLKDIIESYV